MGRQIPLVRRAMLAALLTIPSPVLSEVDVHVDDVTGNLFVSGLNSAERAELLADDGLLRLHVAGLGSTRGMPFSLLESGEDMTIDPRFSLQPGIDYSVSLTVAGDNRTFLIAVEASQAPTPNLVRFEPSQSVIPENTLRVYLHFSEPMARGQIRDAITLLHSDGTPVPSPFLTLGPELWDNSQTRVTLLFDPGRIKQGVGPNTTIGPPLDVGETYRLVVNGMMESAAGEALGADATVNIRVGPAVRTSIDPDDWQIVIPPSGGHTPLSVSFDRILDTGAVRRFLTLQDQSGVQVPGVVETDGGGWSITPNVPWVPGQYTLVIDPSLEDVSGNRIRAPFDAETGTIGHPASEGVNLMIDLTQ